MRIALANIFLRHVWLKLFSVGLATVIWLGIHRGIHSEVFPEVSIDQLNIDRLLAQKDIRIPVSIVQTPDDHRVFKITPAEVVVIAVGDQRALLGATQKTIKVYVDLTRFTGAESMAEDVRVDVPPNINVLDMSPHSVSVEQVRR
jgi:hypothetical protein